MTAKPGCKFADLIAFYHAEGERRHQAYLESPEGKKAARERVKEIRRKQKKCNQLIAILPSLNFDDFWEVILWLKLYRDASDDVGVHGNHELVINALLENGFLPNVNCKDEYRENDKENSARWLIGQAIVLLQRYGCIHPMFPTFAMEWRKRFYPIANLVENFKDVEIGDAVSVIAGLNASVRGLDGIADFMNTILGENMFDASILAVADLGNGRLEFKALAPNLYRSALRCKLFLFREKPNLFKFVSAGIDKICTQINALTTKDERDNAIFDWVSCVYQSCGPRPFRIGHLPVSMQ